MVDITNMMYLKRFGWGYPSRKGGELFLLDFSLWVLPPHKPENRTFQIWPYYIWLESIFDADQYLIKKQGPEINV